MTKHLRTVKATLIMGILLISVIPFLANQGVAATTKAISFSTYLDLYYNSTDLNQPLQIDVAVSVPVTVKFWTDIPDIFSKGFPINYLILFGKPLGPSAKIQLKILESPEWANIYFSSSDLLTDYPFKNDGVREVKTNLIISPKFEAPAEPQKIDIQLTLDTLKRVNGYTTQVSIPFTPSFNPTVAITTENPIRTINPHTPVSFKITVKNSGNKITRVTPTIIGASEDWTPTINPPQFEIPPNQESTFTFSVITPYNFGWHNEYGRFEVSIRSEIYPYQSNSPSQTQSIYLVVNNNGFSTPGFEFAIFVVAILGVLLIIRKRHYKN